MEPIRGTGYYEHTKVKTQTATAKDEGENFSLNDQAKKKQQENTATQLEQDGVVVELSRERQNGTGNFAYNRESDTVNKTEEGQSLTQMARQLIDSIRQFTIRVQEFFISIQGMVKRFWNDEDIIVESTKDIASDGNIEQSAEQLVVPDPNSKEYVNQIEEYLEQRQGSYVKNSDLLTYYDRRGNLVKMNGSDRNRILRGDKGEIKG